MKITSIILVMITIIIACNTETLFGGYSKMEKDDYENNPQFKQCLEVLQKGLQTRNIEMQGDLTTNLLEVYQKVVNGVLYKIFFNANGKKYEAEVSSAPWETNEPVKVLSVKAVEKEENKVGGFLQAEEESLTNNEYYQKALKALQTAILNYPSIEDNYSANLEKSVFKVFQQVVNGLNFKIYFGDSENKYMGSVYVPTGNEAPEVQDIFKYLEDKIKPITKPTKEMIIVGKFSSLQRKKFSSDKMYQEGLYHLEKEASKYGIIINDDFKITEVEKQVVAGINYRIYFESIKNKYVAIVYVNLPQANLPPVLMSIHEIINGLLVPLQSIETDKEMKIGGFRKKNIEDIDSKELTTILEVLSKYLALKNINIDLKSSIEEVYVQLVAGLNYKILFSANSNKYLAVIFVPLPVMNAEPSVTYVKVKKGENYFPLETK